MVWSAAENTTIQVLENDGFGPIDARIMTAMVSRRYAREFPKLVDVLSGHVGLEDTIAINSGLQGLLSREILTQTPYSTRILTSISPNYDERLRELNHQKSADALKPLQESPIPRFASLGPMTDPRVLQTFRDAVSGAQRIIRIAFFTSLADIEGIDDLHNRAQAGVIIRILLGSPRVMDTLRGHSHRQRAIRAINSWTAKTRNWPNTEVRLANRPQDIECGSSLSVDGRLLRFDVHEPLAERSLMGEMLLVQEAGGNLIRMFDTNFDSAWNRAVPTRGLARVRSVVFSWKWTLATVVATVLALSLKASAWREIVAAIAATCLFAALDESRDRIRALWWGVRHGH